MTDGWSVFNDKNVSFGNKHESFGKPGYCTTQAYITLMLLQRILLGVKTMAEGKKIWDAVKISQRKFEWSGCVVNCIGMGEHWVITGVVRLGVGFSGCKSPIYTEPSNDKNIKGITLRVLKSSAKLISFFFFPEPAQSRWL